MGKDKKKKEKIEEVEFEIKGHYEPAIEPRRCCCKRKVCCRITMLVVPLVLIAALVIIPFTLLAEDPSMKLVIELTRHGERASGDIFPLAETEADNFKVPEKLQKTGA